MADNTEGAIPRFDFLAGRFFDGLLTDAEDRELVNLLDVDPKLAKRFLIQVEIERILILQGDPRRAAKSEFVESVARGVRMISDPADSVRFAKQVATLIRNSRESAPHQAIPLNVSRRRKSVRPSMLSPWAIAGSLAAMVAITLLLTRESTPTTPQEKPIAVVSAPEPRSKNPLGDFKNEASELPRMIVTPEIVSSAVVAEEAATPPQPATTPDFFAEDIEHNALTKNSTAAAKQPQERTAPKKASEPVVARPESGTLSELGRVSQVVGCSVVLRRAAGGEMAVRRVEIAGEGDLIRVGALEASPSDPKVANAGCEIRLNDGTRMWLKPNSALRMRQVNGAFRPILENGEALVHAAKQKPETPLTIVTAQGAAARVLGTVFTVKAEPQSKRVMLYVEEGKVAFSHQGEERIVLADEACLAEDGKSPSLPYQYRPRACTLAGTVLDREKNTPVVGATVIAAPVAQMGGSPIQYKTETNAQGKYSFDALPEGPAFVYVLSETVGDTAKERGTVTRTRLEPAAKNTANVLLDSALVVKGRVTENGLGLSDYRVRLVKQGSDGLSFNAAKSGSLTWKFADGDYNDGFIFMAMEGAGRYMPIVERKGMLAKPRTGNQFDLRSDREPHWFIDATFSPSAQLKGRIAGPSGAALGDDPAKLKDPQHVRSIMTLKSATGQTQIALADANGEFVFDTNLSTGLYELRVERFGFQTDSRRVNLVEGKTLDLTVQLKPSVPVYRK